MGNKNEVLKGDSMLKNDMVIGWCEVEHDLYEENGYVFGVELDLFNNHKYYYCKTVEDGSEYYEYFKGDIYSAIEQFNALLEAV